MSLTWIARRLAIGLAVLPLVAGAQAWPARPVNWVVPYPAGGPADVIARAIAPRMARELGQPVLVENLGGVGGALAAQKVLNAPADGYTVLQGSPNEVILAPLARAAVKLKLEDFVLVSPATNNPLVLLTRKALAADDLDAFAALARSSTAQPLTYGSVGVGSMFHLAAEDLAARMDARVMHVPYSGGAPLIQDLGGANLDFALMPFTTGYLGLAETGRLKILAVASKQRLAQMKNVPTFAESRVAADYEAGAWAGPMVRKGTPAAVVERLHKALQATLADPQVRTTLEASGSQVSERMSLAEAARFLAAEAERYRTLARRIGVRPE
ncbi:tripartite tricarboxylate transporter substrate binding protein [Variovorax sp.]|jgi:tripartite-type tricarboxylate transporter receptor subunit TctC|uniref:tripartite tricarboxylate transporter substrate binding protein n=1 Tax=Variovorax sp. TaxID=1871043 RepID=UPI0037D9CC42